MSGKFRPPSGLTDMAGVWPARMPVACSSIDTGSMALDVAVTVSVARRRPTARGVAVRRIVHDWSRLSCRLRVHVPPVAMANSLPFTPAAVRRSARSKESGCCPRLTTVSTSGGDDATLSTTPPKSRGPLVGEGCSSSGPANLPATTKRLVV